MTSLVPLFQVVQGVFSTLFKEYVLLLNLENISQDGWYLDYGVSCHITRECDIFQPPRSVANRLLVRCGIHIEGELNRRGGSIVFVLESGWTLTFHHVLYVPHLILNVLSISSLEDQGYTVEFKGHSV